MKHDTTETGFRSTVKIPIHLCNMDRNQARSLYLKIIFGALGFATYALVASVLSYKPETDPVSTIESMVRLPTRLPAAIPVKMPDVIPNVFNQTARVPDPIRIDTVAVSCWGGSANQSVNTSARWVRLTGRSCDGKLKAESWEVLNESNGFSATVFIPAPKQLTTDYIPLKEGANEIKMVALSEDGVRHETILKIDRN